MKYSLIDLHCDTLYELFVHGKDFHDPSLAVCFTDDFSDTYEHYLQVAAFWCDSQWNDEKAFDQFAKAVSFFRSNAFQRSELSLIQSYNSSSLLSGSKNQLVLAVEDARLLAGDIDRLAFLKAAGVRVLTMVWKDRSCIGGAYNTKDGLTDFGRTVVCECPKLGIIPDISHASEACAYEILEYSNTNPVIASHSDSYSVYPHPRNITDELFYGIKKNGGLVGINLYTEHLGIGALQGTDIDIVLKHIDHFLSIGGEDILCFGCDFDGAPTPTRLRHPKDLILIADEMTRLGYSQEVIEKLFWKNGYRFLQKNIFNHEP